MAQERLWSKSNRNHNKAKVLHCDVLTVCVKPYRLRFQRTYEKIIFQLFIPEKKWSLIMSPLPRKKVPELVRKTM